MIRIASASVDRIEDGEFASPPSSQLGAARGADENAHGGVIHFATLHCRNCDGRFSCGSYREYMKSSGKAGRRFNLLKYVEAAHDDGELDDWIDGNIELDLERLFPEAG